MNPFDLRLGNVFFKLNKSGKVHIPDKVPLKILKIGLFESEYLPYEDHPTHSEKYFTVSNNDICGTPIEDWISKTGIKPDIHGQYHFNGYYLHHHHSGVWNVFNATTPHPLTELKFVHEWQNWHYALNKEELKFKL